MLRQIVSVLAVGAALAAVPAGASAAAAPRGASATAATQSPYPSVGQGTHFLDDAALLGTMSEKGWYEANIPFVDLPDKTIQDVYYYRWRVWREHIRSTGTANGDIITEFFGNPGYAAPYGAIDAAAALQMADGRWVRDSTYLEQYIDYWLLNAGAGPKPATDEFNANQTDWAHEYSFWVASAVAARAEVSGDWGQAEALLPALVRQYDIWDNQYNPQLGLYWQVPVWDAMEYSASSYESDPADPYHGGAGYRPTLNAYQYGDARAIALIAARAGDPALAARFAKRATTLQTAMQRELWDPSRDFFYDMPRDDNPGHQLLSAREEIGFIPWMFDMPRASDSVAWKQLIDPQGFASTYGPTTVEQRSHWFMYQADQGCCRWDGPSWPYATSQTLTGMANLLDDYHQDDVTATDYDQLLHTYAATQYENGVPHVGQAHDPTQDDWIYDANDYEHSDFADLVLSGLLGLRPQAAADALVLKPLLAKDSPYFAVENAPYHGHNITVLWDRDGSRYHQGRGLHVYEDGRLIASAPTLHAMRIRLVDDGGDHGTPAEPFTDLAANDYGTGDPQAFASFTGSSDSAAGAIDGQVIDSDDASENSRWTDYGSPNATDDLGVDFGAAVPLDEVRLHLYDDTALGGGVAVPASYSVQEWTGSAWATIPGQVDTPATPVPDALNRVTFPQITTSQIRVVFTRQAGEAVGASELEAGAEAPRPGGLWIDGSHATAVTLSPGQSSTVTTTLPVWAPPSTAVHLDAPTGWQVSPESTAGRTERWSVTPPTSATGAQAALYADAELRGGTIYGRLAATVAFSPAAYSETELDDGFTTDDLSNYTQLLPAVTSSTGEQAPTFTIGGGQATATLGSPYFGVLQSSVAPGVADSAAIVTAGRFLGDAGQQDSLFVGEVADSGDYVMAWYNNVFQTSGIDLVQNGTLNPSPYPAPCCADVTLAPGDRFALAVSGTTVSSYVQHGGTGPWQELESASLSPFLDFSDPATNGTYRFAFGLRGDAGTMSAEGLEGLGAP